MYQEAQPWCFLVEVTHRVGLCGGNKQNFPEKQVAFSQTGLTGLPQMFPSLGLCKRDHLVELGVNVGVLEAPEMDAFAVNDTI